MAEKNKNRGTKRAPITLDDEKPTEKDVKKEVEKEASLPTVVELQEKLANSERLREKAIRIAGTYLERMEYLENLIDKKPELVKEKAMENEELEKKASGLKEELDEERRKTSE
ncbi:hypothetical protein PMAYCL1PPCAC_13775, partial [Pristionchus mayeri]